MSTPTSGFYLMRGPPLTSAAAGFGTTTGGTGASVSYSAGINLTVSAGSVGSIYALSNNRVHGGESPAGDYVDLAARVTITSGNTDADGVMWFGMGSIGVAVTGDGAAYLCDNAGSQLTSPIAGAVSSGNRTGGNLWLRFVRTPLGVAGYVGVATGPHPSTWTCIGIVSTVAALNGSKTDRVTFGAFTGGSGVAAGWTVRMDGMGAMGPSAIVAREGN